MVANKIELNGKIILDLTNDTITEKDVLYGVKFHLPNGEEAEGTLRIEAKIKDGILYVVMET